MIYIPKIKQVQQRGELPTIKFGVGGEFRLVRYNCMGQINFDTGWFHNLITDTGLVNFHTVNWYDRIHIGNSSIAPTVANTQLFGPLSSGLSSHVTGSRENSLAPDFIVSSMSTRRFGPGDGTGTIREVGVNHTGVNTSMCIRALVLPEVSKAADETVDVFYRFRIYPFLADSVGTTFFNGVEYNYTLRGSNLDLPVATSWPSPIARFLPFGGSSHPYVYTGEISADVTGMPSGSNLGGVGGGLAASPVVIGSGSGYFDCEMQWGLSTGNGNIRSSILPLWVGSFAPSHWGWQIRFGKVSDNTPIVKDNTYEFKLQYRCNWSRH